MKKALVKIIFGHNDFICQPIFDFLRNMLGLFGCKRMKRSHFAGGVSEQGDFQKSSFLPKDGVSKVVSFLRPPIFFQ